MKVKELVILGCDDLDFGAFPALGSMSGADLAFPLNLWGLIVNARATTVAIQGRKQR